MSPRPILKSLPDASSTASRTHSSFQTVHFPPTPNLSATYLTHSRRTYDRSAITVSPNDCALPERNCPGRTYILCGDTGEGRHLKSSVLGKLHSDGEDAARFTESTQRTDYFSVTTSSLTPDLILSESDDSDRLTSPLDGEVEDHPGHPPTPHFELSMSGNEIPHDPSPSNEDVQAALSFRLHPPPLARERKRNISLRGHKRKTPHFFSGDNGILVPFAAGTPPVSSCLDGF